MKLNPDCKFFSSNQECENCQRYDICLNAKKKFNERMKYFDTPFILLGTENGKENIKS